MRIHETNETNATNRPGERSGPGRPRSSSADQAILRAALELFIQSGIAGVTIEQIAATAGVARTTVYRRWSSKEALLAQALAVARGSAEEQAAANRSELKGLSGRLVEALVETVAAPEYVTMVARLVGSVPDCPDLMATYWHTYMAPRRAWIGHMLRRAQAAGLLGADADPEILLDLISGAIVFHLLIRPGKRTAEDMREYIVRMLHQLGLEETGESTLA